jgi:Ca2+/Na+ antiporter
MTSISALLIVLQNDSSRVLGAAFGGAMTLIWLAVVVAIVVGGWKMFEKAGQPGWAILIPFYNAYIMLKIAGRPGWWLLLYLIPLVNIAIVVIVAMDIAKSFGQSAAWGFFLLFLLCGIGYLILGFGSAHYVGPSANARARGAAA